MSNFSLLKVCPICEELADITFYDVGRDNFVVQCSLCGDSRTEEAWEKARREFKLREKEKYEGQ